VTYEGMNENEFLSKYYIYTVHRNTFDVLATKCPHHNSPCHQLGSSNFWRVLHLYIYNFSNCFSTHAHTRVHFVEPLTSIKCQALTNARFHLHSSFKSPRYSTDITTSFFSIVTHLFRQAIIVYRVMKSYTEISLWHNFWFNGCRFKHVYLTCFNHVSIPLSFTYFLQSAKRW